MIIGLDFDNTIINYSKLFTIVAKKKKLLKKNFKFNKNSLKNYLIRHNKEKEWTILQGEVYGKYIMEAKTFKGFDKLLKYLLKKKIKVYIISHKTKYPYLGKKINLRNAASEWIKKNILKLNKNINFSMKNVYFEDSIQKKIIRISQLKCDIFIDDLPLVLELLPEGIDKYLFNPDLSKSLKRNVKLIRSWVEFHKLLKKNA